MDLQETASTASWWPCELAEECWLATLFDLKARERRRVTSLFPLSKRERTLRSAHKEFRPRRSSPSN